jgi:hypothetical protein
MQALANLSERTKDIGWLVSLVALGAIWWCVGRVPAVRAWGSRGRIHTFVFFFVGYFAFVALLNNAWYPGSEPWLKMVLRVAVWSLFMTLSFGPIKPSPAQESEQLQK